MIILGGIGKSNLDRMSSFVLNDEMSNIYIEQKAEVVKICAANDEEISIQSH